VLATRTTIDGHRVAALIERERGRDVQFLLEACPTLVELVERGDLAGSRTEEAVSGYVTPLVDRHADVIVLGCTHFHWLRSIVSGVAGAEVTVIDPGGAVARQLHRRLDEADLLSRRERPGLERFWSSSREDSSALFTRLWGSPVQVHPLSL
jgi:glutamate racemase